MIPHDLTQSIKVSLKTATGQLGYILSKIDDVDQVENILLQLKAVQSMLTKTTYELLDDTYRKALAERISSAYQSCPGDCGNEETIEKLRTLFPELKLEEVPEKLREARMVEEELKKFLSERLDTPSPRD
ncbi:MULTISPECIES: metal-sensing transcriptional repressor [Cytophagales]|jgi:DNA-binding FrmR family transcriptional regulator|uniref:Metal-sensitive transcriptional repressor n=2 Tax=Cytophagales TaxID=768507 RepID=A0A4Q7PEQ9_9BACT|nr:metal-sensing transcriptional repressor [Cecembia calidifontis]RZS98150.1 metal-sensitive transcriptional repressor [Cecembia calidifontis]